MAEFGSFNIVDKPREECGVFGVFNHPNAAELTYYGLNALQHRGQEGAGIVSSDGHSLHQHVGVGLVRDVFKQPELDELRGIHAIGHVRYATCGGSGRMNIQPFLFRSLSGPLGLCHNGNLVNANELRAHLEQRGSIFQTTSDSEILAHLVKRQRGNLLEALRESLLYVEGAFAFLLLKENKLYCALDKWGLRPLSLGRIGQNSYVLASETCAFETVGAEYIRDIQPGEVLKIAYTDAKIDDAANGTPTTESINVATSVDTESGAPVKANRDSTRRDPATAEVIMESKTYAVTGDHKMCSMEYVYFARPDSDIEGINVHQARKRCGRILAEEAPAPTADIVIGVPDSGLSAAVGFAEAAGIPFEIGMIKNKYVGRTFIEPSQELREQGVKMKLSAVRSIVRGKSVVLVDDSIVRGTTSRKIVQMIRDAGAREVHVRISSPVIKYPCFYGVAFSTFDELIGAHEPVKAIQEMLGADSLAYLSIEGLTKGVGRDPDLGRHAGQCVACFNGSYPTYLYEDIHAANLDEK